MREALLCDTPLIPVLHFGENALFHQYPAAHSSKTKRFQVWFERKFGFSVPIVYGVTPNIPMIAPDDTPLVSVVGAPVDDRVSRSLLDEMLGLPTNGPTA